MTGGAKSGLYTVLRLGVRYGPVALAVVRRSRPAADLGSRTLGRRTAQRAAYEHALHLIDGSLLPVYDGDTRVWVVFSGELPVATHPVTRTPMETLLRHYDLSRRATPPASTRQIGPLRSPAGPSWGLKSAAAPTPLQPPRDGLP